MKLKCVIVDDERLACEGFVNLCSHIEDLEVEQAFCDSLDALDYLTEHPVDLVFLDIQMPGMDGLELGRKLQELPQPPNVIYLTSYIEYAYDAFQVDALSYLLKPCQTSDIQRVVNRITKQSNVRPVSQHRVYIRTFGSFDVFVDGKLLPFGHARAKELMAILVDGRGGFVTSEKIMDYMFEGVPPDINMQVIYRKSRMFLKQTLQKYDVDDILIQTKGGGSVDATKFDCDLYDYLAGKPEAKKLFLGEYMTNYSWGEFTLGLLMF